MTRNSRAHLVLTASLVAATAGTAPACSPERPATDAEPASERVGAAAEAPPLGDARVAWERTAAEIAAHADSADRRLRTVPNLSPRERTELRRDVNAMQIERARQLGVPAGTDVRRLVASGRLVRLEESTPHWVVRELDFSEPYVVPSAKAMLAEIGERFHARLDSLGIPRFRLDITSVLRTPELQAELRRRNRNASQVESSHEFGTTLDIAYRRFAPPLWTAEAGVHPELEPQARELADTTFLEVGRLRGAELEAVLGRVLQEMRAEGKLLVIRERGQTVFHVTVAQRYAEAEGGGLE